MDYPDKLGVYRVGDLKFYSKLEAIEMHTKTGIYPQWDFNEAVFSSYNWTVEPEETILELYKQRAQQLRDQYDYIALFWSGGADSETVRRAFNDNDIKLDEIVTYSNYEATNDKTDLMNSELFFRTIPQATKLQQDYPYMKFRILDLSDLYLTNFDNNDTKFDWFYNMNMMFTPNHVVRDGIGLKVKEWADMINKGKKFCLLWGIDKPRVFHDNNKFSFKFLDMVDLGPKVKSMAGLEPYTDELFFWTPDKPEIAIKQGHMIKNYLNANLTTSPFISKKSSQLAYKTVNGVKYWLNNHGVHTVVYPQWDITTFDAGKPPSTVFSPRDNWFFNLEESNYAKKMWSMGVEYLHKRTPDYWKNDPTDISRGLKGCWSKEYFLEK